LAGAARDPRSRAASAAADLPRPSAEEASPDIGTSDALCHTAGAGDRALLSSLQRLPGRNDPHQRARRIRLVVTPACLRPAQLVARTPSIGSIFGFASEAGSRSLTVRLRARAPHPFTHCESTLLVKDEPPRQATPSRLHAPFGALYPGREDASFRLLQPTTRHEHPVNRSIPESPSSTAFAFEDGFHGRPPGRSVGERRDLG